MVRERLVREGRLGTAVEFGRGTVFFTETLAAKAGRLVATDLSLGMLGLARARVTAPHVTFQAEDCQATAFSPDAFDTAFPSASRPSAMPPPSAQCSGSRTWPIG
jgi:ubiquinone/menaquinone biosynthesis C-methylase UbiE